MSFQATVNQQRAIDSRGAVLVSAAAGSGKTAVLVERIISCILDPVHPMDVNRMLVVTFTNASAAEMQERIRRRLEEEARKDPGNLRLLRQQMLLNKANISTIDSFCKALVSEHFDLLELSPDFTLLSESNLSLIKKSAMEDTLNHFFTTRKEDFTQLAKTVGADPATGNLEQAIETVYEYIRSLPFPRQWTDRVREQYRCFSHIEDSVWGQALLHKGKAVLQRGIHALTYALQQLSEDPVVEEKRGPRLADTLKEWMTLRTAMEQGDWDTTAALCGGLKKISFQGVSLPKGYDSPAKALTVTMQAVSEKIAATLQKLFRFSAEECKSQCRLLAPAVDLLLDSVWEYSRRIDERKKEANSLDFADLEYAALKLLVEYKDGQTLPTPYAETICESFDCVMVDEYQDVNDLQSAIFNALSRNGQTLFTVGDIKQSIYRFRKANPKNFARLLRTYPDYDGACSPGKIILDGNFRSRPELCETVNGLFSFLMTEQAGDIVYDRTHALQSLGQFPKARCPVQMEFLEEEEQREAAQLEADRIALHIRQAMETPCVTDGDTLRPARPGDIVILLRSPKNKAAAYLRRLREHNIPAVAEQSDGFFERPEIAHIVSLLRALDNPTDDIPLLSAMMSPLYGFTADEVASIRGGQKKLPLYTCVEQAAARGHRKAADLLLQLQELRTYAATVSPRRLLQRIFDRYHCMAAAQMRENAKERRQNLLTLMDLAEECSRNGYDRLDGFVRYLTKLQQEGISPAVSAAAEKSDAVQLMSIHHSKGLQFPVCILAGCGGRFNKSDATAPILLDEALGLGLTLTDDEKQLRIPTAMREAVATENQRAALSEELRVLYVAMTRAIDRLIVITTLKNRTGAMEKAAGQLIGGLRPDGRLHPELALSAEHYGQLLLYFALLHPAGGALRTCASHPYGCLDTPADGCVFALPDGWQIPAPADGPVSPLPDNRPTDAALTAQIARQLAYSDPYAPLQNLFSKRSVSQLVHDTPEEPARIAARPAFLQAGGLSSAEKGTALHAFMQYADYENAAADALRERQRLVDLGFITQKQSEAIDIQKLHRFFNSRLYARMKASPCLLREQRFMQLVSACELDSSLPAAFAREQVVIQGIADCIFEEQGQWIVVDYKTDRVTAPEELTRLYADQLRFYARMLEQSEDKPVGELLIYSFALEQTVRVDRPAPSREDRSNKQ